MKNLLLSILFIITEINLHAQDYHPLLDTNTVWTVEYDYWLPPQPSSYQRNFKYKNDTIIDGITYKNFGYNALLREDISAKKVFMRSDSYINNECLLYDFNASTNDTLTICNGHNFIIIDSVSTYTMNNGEERKIFYYQAIDSQEFFIEGIGYSEGFITVSELLGPPAFNLMCVKKNGEEIYGERCDEVVSILKPIRKVDNITIYPNPTNSNLYFETNLLVTSYKIIDISGRYIDENIISGSTIELYKLKAGMYILELYNNKKEVLSRNRFIFNQ